MQTLSISTAADGIATITLDDSAKPMNVVSPQFIEDMNAAIAQVESDPLIKGAIITSAKPAFMAGADLKYILSMMEAGITVKDAYAFSQTAQAMHRRLETCGKPFVAALNGLALGGGYELALACHHRIIVDAPQAIVGLPEVTVGLLPGSGGTQRLARLIGIEKALTILVDGNTPAPAEALKLGLVDTVVPAEQLLPAARQWLLGNPDPVRLWDKKGYAGNGGLLNLQTANLMSMRAAAIAKATRHNYPAPIAILDSVFEGMIMPFDKALTIESKHFAKLFADPVARNIIRTTFVNKGEAAKLARRPAGIPRRKFSRVGVLGAGMMGSGIAYVAAAAGLDVILLDSQIEFAEKGKAYSSKVLEKRIAKNKATRERADEILARITPTIDYADLAQCDMIVEAVFEDKGIKAGVTSSTEAVIAASTIFASNTSTLPISQLAEASKRPDQFIGLHFFSPVDRMPLVEVILGKQTNDKTLAEALDFVAQLRMVPIVVNDSRGFYTSRVFQTFIHEGMKMLEDGIELARIENAAIQAGFPIGPLALVDETTIALPWKIVQETKAAEGEQFRPPCAYEIMRRMIEEFDRPGRKYHKGFYDYTEDGKKTPWPGFAQVYPLAADQPDVEELKKRFLYIQALETARCLEEGVLTHPADGDIGSILAWGFPSWTGGTLSFIDTVGTSRFVEECKRMAALYGPRFKPSPWLELRAERGENFYAKTAAGG